MRALGLLMRGKAVLTLLSGEGKIPKVGGIDALQLLEQVAPYVEQISTLDLNDATVRKFTDLGLDEEAARFAAAGLKKLMSLPSNQLQDAWAMMNDPRILLSLWRDHEVFRTIRNVLDQVVVQREGRLPLTGEMESRFQKFLSDTGVPDPGHWSERLRAFEREVRPQDISFTPPAQTHAFTELPTSSQRPGRRRRRKKKKSPQTTES